MKASVIMLLAAAALPLGACASTNDSMAVNEPAPLAAAPSCPSVGGSALTGAGIGAAGGAGVGALAGGVGIFEGALIGAAVGGLAGAIWADANNDGCADGYIREGRYYEGSPYYSAPASQPSYRSGERG